MPLKIDPELQQVSISLLQWLGVPSLVGFLSLYVAWLTFPPELVIESVVDKSNKFNSESRIKIKNNGKLTAIDIKAEVENLYASIESNSFKVKAIINYSNAVSRLSSGEHTDISISPCFHIGQGTHITSFSYILILKYHAKLFSFRKEFKKQWRVELRTFEDGFAWNIVPF